MRTFFSVAPWLFALLVGLTLGTAACTDGEKGRSGEAPTIVTTIPPFGMILQPVVEGRATVRTLLAPGASPHAYEPSPSDMRAVGSGLLLVYGAETLDGWAAGLSDEHSLSLVDLVPPEVQLRMDDEAGTVDPHFWTDPKAVSALLPALADTLCAVDGAGCQTYRANADTFAATLDTLDARLVSMMAPVSNASVLLAQPFFRYFLNRYGPRLAGIVALDPSAEPSPRRVQEMHRRAEAAGARVLLTQRARSGHAANAVAEAAGLSVVTLDPLGGVEGRATYADLLFDNARRLREALDTAKDVGVGSAPDGTR